MNLLKKFEVLAKRKAITLGIGLGESINHNQKLLEACVYHLKKYNSKILIFGTQNNVNSIQLKDYDDVNIEIIESDKPVLNLFKYLSEKKVIAIVRGSLSSSTFLKNLKSTLNVKEINRLALLETFDGHQFFYGPVGIDECNSLEKKINFIKFAINQFKIIDITPKISILSGGRKSDIGRDSKVDDTIKNAEKIVKIFKDKTPNLDIIHDEILIENAINNKSNLIIAPDGISGNLIYRTLVHLGGGNAYGAIYMGLKDTIIDTSRAGKSSEIQGALLLALALAKE